MRTAHSFSFGQHYDAANTSYGLLVAHDEHVVDAGSGFPAHAHRGVEIVTWVLRGSLLHRDATGHTEVLRPGHVQCTSAGRGTVHTETNGADARDDGAPLRFVQAWVVPEKADTEPAYDRREVDDARLASDLVPVASGRPEHTGGTAVHLGQRNATLLVARPPARRALRLPAAPHVHLFVAEGVVDLEAAGTLRAGDTARLTGTAGLRLTAVEPAEVLVWEMHGGLRG